MSEGNTPLLLIVLLPQFGSCWKSVRESCLDKCVVDGWDRMFTWSTCWTNSPAILSWSSVTRVLIPSALHWCCVILDSQLFHYTARCHRWVSCWFPRMPMNVTCDAFHSESFPCQCCSGPRGTTQLWKGSPHWKETTCRTSRKLLQVVARSQNPTLHVYCKTLVFHCP